MTNNIQKPIVLCILDGWGYRENTENNAIKLANTPNWNKLISTYPHTLLKTSGLDVGLPAGQMGNSEVGHTNIGAGRVVMQDLPRIDMAISDDTLKTNPILGEMIQTLKENGKDCHLMGLMSDGGVHSHINHFIALAKIIAEAGINVWIDAYMDGRDTPPKSGINYIKEFINQTKDYPNIKIAVVSGRYYAMDRDNRWERVSLAYNALTKAEAPRFATATEAMESSYQQDITDEFIVPCVIGDYVGMNDGDAFLMVNYRSDRAREITQMLAEATFDKAPREKVVHFSACVGMTQYSAEHTKWLKTLFPPEELSNILGEVLAQNNKKQLRIAETEKYAHVTFFFNGGEEKQFDGEERILIPSPKVATYDLQPEMSAIEVTDKLVDAVENGGFDVIIVNFANCDMVGHTGILPAAIKAVETVDTCIGRLYDAVMKQNGIILMSADHGNAEMMKDEATGSPYTAHTTFDVPCLLINAPKEYKIHSGRLSDIAPTILELMNIEQPEEMNGKSLIEK